MDKLRLKAQIRRHEGLRLSLYDCPAGFKTIGYGRNLEQRGITTKEAETLLDNDIEIVEKEVRGAFPDLINKLCESRVEVLFNLAFNMGVPRLKQFRKMLAALMQNTFELAAAELLDSRYAEQTGDRAKELADILKTGRYGFYNGK